MSRLVRLPAEQRRSGRRRLRLTQWQQQKKPGTAENHTASHCALPPAHLPVCRHDEQRLRLLRQRLGPGLQKGSQAGMPRPAKHWKGTSCKVMNTGSVKISEQDSGRWGARSQCQRLVPAAAGKLRANPSPLAAVCQIDAWSAQNSRRCHFEGCGFRLRGFRQSACKPEGANNTQGCKCVQKAAHYHTETTTDGWLRQVAMLTSACGGDDVTARAGCHTGTDAGWVCH